MTRTYELVFIVEPRQSDDDVQAITEKYLEIVTSGGASIRYVDHWGKRKLAYPIQNYNEGKYVVVYVTADGEVPWPDVERLMMQDEKILRHLVVRTDEDLKRAARGKVQPKMPWDSEDKAREEKGASRGA
ncbi:MAG: 30S ribosomal protein S6 [Acidobacteriota bacterium]